MPLKLAIVGRPNVGKSTLFNRLVGKKIALVDDQPGVTRDRKQAEGYLASLPLILIDTAGYETSYDDSLESRMRQQTEAAIAEAELALFLIDARVGVTPEDENFAALLRKANIPIVLAANKAEGKQFIAFLMQEDNVRPYVEGALGRWFPVTKASQASPFWQADRHRKAVWNQFTGGTTPFDFTKNW